MTRRDVENIIDTLHLLARKAEEILDAGTIPSDEIFSSVKPFLGDYCGSTVGHTAVLDSTTIHHCRQHIKTNFDGYYSATEFFDIDLDPIRDLAELLDAEDRDREADLIWAVVDFMEEIREWADHQSDTVPDQPHVKHPRHQQRHSAPLTQDQFLALFDDKNCRSHKALLLLKHIRDVAHEKKVHLYYGALVANSKNLFKINEQDFASLLRNFLSVAGLDPALAANVRETKLTQKVLERAKMKLAEINRTREHQ